jgi:hypothetical protein
MIDCTLSFIEAQDLIKSNAICKMTLQIPETLIINFEGHDLITIK